MVRAQVEIMFGPDEEVAVPWRALVGSSHATTSYARFVRDHPYLPTYYEWLIKDSVTNLPTWGDVHHGIVYNHAGSETSRSRSHVTLYLFGGILTNLVFTRKVQVGPVLLCHAPDPRVAEPPPQVFLGQVVIPILHCIPAATFDHQN